MSYTVTNPATGELVADRGQISDADLDGAIARASAARAWAHQTSVAERAALIRTVGDLHVERRDELGATLVREMGKPLAQALGEVDFAADIYRYYAEISPEELADRPIGLRAGTGSALIRCAPLGVILGVMPWNFPFYQVARFAGPNIIIGNPVLVKPASQCPDTAVLLGQIFADAGVGDAYIPILAASSQIAGVIADPRVAGVSLTGSESAGAAVAEVAGRHLKKVVCELGGTDPLIVLSTDDLDAVADDAVNGRLDNNGQSCNAPKRFIVIDDLYDAFVEKVTTRMAQITASDPMADGTELGPVSSLAAAERLEDQVARAVQAGAVIRTGGTRKGAFFDATVLTDIPRGSDIYYEEFFGPVAQIFKVGSEAEAIEVANDTRYGLGSYLYTTDPAQAQRVADAIEAGMVFVNCVLADGAELPFGGVKRSGFGRELGRLGAAQFVNRKLIRIA